MTFSPTKLEVLVQERYQGSMDRLVEAAEQMYEHLRELQKKKLDGPRLQYHNLRSEWPAERCDEFEQLAKGLLYDRIGVFTVKRSIVYRGSTDKLHAIPLWLPVGFGSCGLVMTGIALPIVGPTVATVVASALGIIGSTAVVSAFELAQSNNPFEEVGWNLVNGAENYSSMRKVDEIKKRYKKQI